MRFSKSNWNASFTMLVTAALIVMAGVAGAIFDDNVDIDPSEKYNGSGGYLNAADDTFGAGVYMMCQNADNDFEIGCDTTHPDSANMTPQQGKVDQKKNENNATAWISAGTIGGVMYESTWNLDCEQVRQSGKANDNKFTADAMCTLTKCDIPGGLTVDEIISMQDCIDEAEENGDIGKKVSTLKLDSNNQLKGKIKSAGDWD
jgi:hypothetical protein